MGRDDTAPAGVELIHPDGRPYTATTPTELNNLVVGRGYRIADGRSLTTATADLTPGAEPPATTTTVEPTGTAPATPARPSPVNLSRSTGPTSVDTGHANGSNA